MSPGSKVTITPLKTIRIADGILELFLNPASLTIRFNNKVYRDTMVGTEREANITLFKSIQMYQILIRVGSSIPLLKLHLNPANVNLSFGNKVGRVQVSADSEYSMIELIWGKRNGFLKEAKNIKIKTSIWDEDGIDKLTKLTNEKINNLEKEKELIALAKASIKSKIPNIKNITRDGEVEIVKAGRGSRSIMLKDKQTGVRVGYTTSKRQLRYKVGKTSLTEEQFLRMLELGKKLIEANVQSELDIKKPTENEAGVIEDVKLV